MLAVNLVENKLRIGNENENSVSSNEGFIKNDLKLPYPVNLTDVFLSTLD